MALTPAPLRGLAPDVVASALKVAAKRTRAVVGPMAPVEELLQVATVLPASTGILHRVVARVTVCLVTRVAVVQRDTILMAKVVGSV